jgi:hypothetical protein
MNNLIKFTFDIFGHVIPGIIILIAISLLTISFDLNTDYGMVSEIMNNLEGTGKGAFVIILSYIIGFAVTPFGKYLYRKIGPKLWSNFKLDNDIKKMHISDKFILIREYSPVNFEYVERWNMYSTLSHNLAVGCLFFFVVSVIKIIIESNDYNLNWIVIAAVSIILFFTFIRSALLYNQWAGRDLNSAISALKLREKSE